MRRMLFGAVLVFLVGAALIVVYNVVDAQRYFYVPVEPLLDSQTDGFLRRGCVFVDPDVVLRCDRFVARSFPWW